MSAAPFLRLGQLAIHCRHHGETYLLESEVLPVIGTLRLQQAALAAENEKLREALYKVSAEARAGYYDGPGLKRFIEIRGLAEEALAPRGGE